MTQETVIHGRSSLPGEALCTLSKPEVVTSNHALMTCSGCIFKAQESVRRALGEERQRVDDLAQKLRELSTDNSTVSLIAMAVGDLDDALVQLDAQLAADAASVGTSGA